MAPYWTTYSPRGGSTGTSESGSPGEPAQATESMTSGPSMPSTPDRDIGPTRSELRRRFVMEAQHPQRLVSKLPPLWDPTLQQLYHDVYRDATPAQQQAFLTARDACIQTSTPDSARAMGPHHTVVLSYFEIGDDQRCHEVHSSHSDLEAAVEAAKSVLTAETTRLRYRTLRIEQCLSGVRRFIEQVEGTSLTEERDVVAACIYTSYG